MSLFDLPCGRGAPRLSFDLDGSLANVQKYLLDLANIVTGLTFTLNQCGSGGLRDLLTDEQWKLVLLEHSSTPASWARIPSFADVDFSTLNTGMLSGVFNGYFIGRRGDLIATGINDATYLSRIWLQRHGVHEPSGVFARVGPRPELLRMLGVTAHLESVRDDFNELMDLGFNVYLMDRPWNQTIQTDRRVYSTNEFVSLALGRFEVQEHVEPLLAACQ